MRRAALCIILTGAALLVTSALPADQPPSESTTASGPSPAGPSPPGSSPAPGADPGSVTDQNTTSTTPAVTTTSSPTRPSSSSPHPGLADPPSAPGIKDSDEDNEEEWDTAIEALADAVRGLMPKPLLALLSEDSEELNQSRVDEGDKDQDSEEGDEDSDEEYDDWFDWGGMFGRRRRRRETGAPETTTAASTPEEGGAGSDEESGEGAGEDEDYDEELLWLILSGKGGAGRRPVTKDTSHFPETLRTVFYRARSRVLSRGVARGQARGQGLGAATHKLWEQLIPMASRALNVSSEGVARGFGGMASRWVGEALYELLFEDDHDGQEDQDGEDEEEDDDPWNLNWDAGVKVNGSFNLSGASTSARGGRPSSRVGRRAGREGEPEEAALSPSAVAYFLVELLGTMAGLSWGVWFAATHAG